VDELPVAELLPGLYREVLGAVARLEQTGHRREAGRVRSEATATYSKAWNESAAGRLRRLRDDALRLAGDKRPTSAMRRWSAAKGRSVEGRPV
jgi:hypothetical protein